MKKGKRDRAVLEKECKRLSAAKLVSFMEKQKAILRKLRRGFSRIQKNEEASILYQQFQADTGKVYANMHELLIATKRMNNLDTQRVRRIKKRTKKCLTTWRKQVNIGGVNGKAKEQGTDVPRGWKRLDLPFKVGLPHRPRRTGTWIRRLQQKC